MMVRSNDEGLSGVTGPTGPALPLDGFAAFRNDIQNIPLGGALIQFPLTSAPFYPSPGYTSPFFTAAFNGLYTVSTTVRLSAIAPGDAAVGIFLNGIAIPATVEPFTGAPSTYNHSITLSLLAGQTISVGVGTLADGTVVDIAPGDFTVLLVRPT